MSKSIIFTTQIYRKAMSTVYGLLALVFVLSLVSCGAEDAPIVPAPEYEVNQVQERGPVKFTLRVSEKSLSIADRFTVLLEVEIEDTYDFSFPSFGDKLEQFGIVDYHTAQPKLLNAGRTLITKSYELEPFLSGDYKIPPMAIEFWEKNKAEAEHHSMESEEIEVTVSSMLAADLENLQIKDSTEAVDLPEPDRTWLWYLVAGIIIVSLLLCCMIEHYRKRIRLEEALRIPAHELAYQQLTALLSKQLVENGELKRFYFGLSDVLRQYIENRFALHAPEQTTEEFLVEMQSGGALPTEHEDTLKIFMHHCDLVKFADYNPESNEVQQTFDTCKSFIETTKSDIEDVVVEEVAA